MSKPDVSQINWNKPLKFVTKLAKEVQVPAEYSKPLKPGSFRFNDGTIQGWTIDQFYDTNAVKMIKIPELCHTNPNQCFGFKLSNYQNRALAAEGNPALALAGPDVTSLDFYLQSPDLSNNTNWKKINGYSIDVHRNYIGACGEGNGTPTYYIQLQVRMFDKKLKMEKDWAEKDEKTDQFVFHPIKKTQPYHFTWVPPTIFQNTSLELRYLRIRVTQPYPKNPLVHGIFECLPKGAWLFGNISPETA